MSLKILNKFIKISQKIAEKKNESNKALKIGNDILLEYKDRGYLHRLFTEVLDYPYLSFVPLLEYLISINNVKDRVVSPVENEKNSLWMLNSSFCFVNIRGTGRKPDETGDIINCAKLMPVLRIDSIHLAPFFECALDIVYAIDSIDVINEKIVNKEFYEYGMSPEEQLIFLVDFLHLLKKSVGFDLEPHTSQYSRIAIENPDYFRWIKLNREKNTLFNNISQEEMLKRELQEEIIKEVIEIRENILKKYNLKNLKERNKDKSTKNAHIEITNKLIEKGIWTIPSHTWKGSGLPSFKKYIKEGNYPEFEYISWDNEDHKEHAFGVLTPYKFYDNLPVNKIPDINNPPILDKKVLKFFSSIFINLQKKYNFDFVRFDYVDHIFDSVLDRSGKIPISDRMTPYLIKSVISQIKRKKRYIGAMAERMGIDLKNYKKIGFDLILGDDILYKISKDFIFNIIKTNKFIEKINKKVKNNQKSSILFAIDTHDTGHPYFNCIPYVMYGKDGVILRHFLSRFLCCGNFTRPKYEVIGMQDGTIGLYEANNKNISIKWQSDVELFNAYNNIENIFESLKSILQNSYFANLFSVKKDIVYWQFKGNNFCIIGIVNLNLNKKYKNIKLKITDNYKNIESINIYNNTKERLDSFIINSILPLEVRLIYCYN
ncbi:MAG TPA: hypothetical protein PLE45_03070 [Spirochaetota bacterium]|nr:hypothetical protein [Spirochaetota bacterium]HOL56549.1 hypothetical protein [Spirochaetota bacterium]HPP03988.1 hypothetical protein [Spirochaetota bacterium]